METLPHHPVVVAQQQHRAENLQLRVADAITAFAGSMRFVYIHAVGFALWMLFVEKNPWPKLTLIVSLEAIFLTGFVLMTQNRMTRQADRRAHLDLQVNMLAEQELTTMLQMLTALCEHTGVPNSIRDRRVAQMSKETDIHTIADAIDRELVDEKAND